MELSQQIEGVLFYKATPIKKTALCKLLAVDELQLEEAIVVLRDRLSVGATRILETDSELQLVTAQELDPLIETIRKDELHRDIGKAGAETLAIILYKAPITRAEIDRIRGVNSSFILRNLLIRGLIERTTEKNGNSFSVTPALLAHMGITHVTELPNYSTVLDTLEKFEQEQTENELATYE